MAPGPDPTNQPEGSPLSGSSAGPPAEGPEPAAQDEGTGLWDASSAWQEEDATAITPAPAARAADAPSEDDERLEDATAWEGVPDEVAWDQDAWAGQQPWQGGSPSYDPADVGYYQPEGTYEEAPPPPGFEATYPPVPVVVPEPPPRRRRSRGPWPELIIVAALAVIAAAAILAVTASKHGGLSSLFGNGAATTAVSTPPASTTPRTTAPAKTTSTPPTTTTTTTPGATTSLPPTALPVPGEQAWNTGLLGSWVTYEKLNPNDVAGIAQVRYAETLSTETFWAIAEFQPSASLLAQGNTPAGKALLADFSSTQYAFSWEDGKTWTVLGSVPSGNCPGIWMPKPVLAALSLCNLHPPRMPPGG